MLFTYSWIVKCIYVFSQISLCKVNANCSNQSYALDLPIPVSVLLTVRPPAHRFINWCVSYWYCHWLFWKLDICYEFNVYMKKTIWILLNWYWCLYLLVPFFFLIWQKCVSSYLLLLSLYFILGKHMKKKQTKDIYIYHHQAWSPLTLSRHVSLWQVL